LYAAEMILLSLGIERIIQTCYKFSIIEK